MNQSIFQLALGAACISLAPIMVKYIADTPNVVAFYRTLLAACMFLPFCLAEILALFDRRMLRFWLFVLLGGLAFAMDLNVWHRSIYYTGAGIATILGNTQVFFSGLAGYFFLKEKLSWPWFVGALLAMLGISMLVGAFGSMYDDSRFVWGVLFGLLTGPFYAAFVFCTRQVQTYANSPSTKTCLCLLLFAAAFFSGLMALREGVELASFVQQWKAYLLLALGSQVFGWLLISRNLTLVPIALSGLILLIQPVLAFVLGAALFAEAFSWVQVLGACITLLAIYVTTVRSTLQRRLQ